jgi:hypothetical protein
MAVVICGVLIAASPIHAQTSQPMVTFHFEGVINAVYDAQGYLGGSVQNGDTFYGTYTFDPTVPDRDTDVRNGKYQFDSPTQFSMTINIGALELTTESDVFPETGWIWVLNTNTRDWYRVRLDSPALIASTLQCSNPTHSVYFTLNGPTWIFWSDNLPTIPPDLSDFTFYNLFAFHGFCETSSNTYSFGGYLTDLYIEAAPVVSDIVDYVLEINVSEGVSNSLDAKLDTALQALDDLNQNNDVAAINALNAFINSVSAQSGNQISTEDADALIALAQAVIAELENP